MLLRTATSLQHSLTSSCRRRRLTSLSRAAHGAYVATERQGESVHKKIRVLSSRLTSAIRLVVHAQGGNSESGE
jgi:hypothetical protein